METHTFFLYLLTILLTAHVMAEIAVRIKAPSVIGMAPLAAKLISLLFFVIAVAGKFAGALIIRDILAYVYNYRSGPGPLVRRLSR